MTEQAEVTSVPEPMAREEQWHKDVALKSAQAKASFFETFNEGGIPKIHPLADAFPYMSDEEIKAIADSIRADGLRNPIIIDIDGNLVDGRNRYMALLQLECKIREEYMADTPSGSYPLVNMKAILDDHKLSVVRVILPEYRYRNKYEEQIKRFILSENMDRRHLTTSQKAGLAALIADEPSALSKKDVLDRFAIGGTIYREARKIKEADDDLFNSVIRGELTVSEAIKALQAKNVPDEPEDEEKDPAPALPIDPEGKVDDIVNPPAPDNQPEKEPDVTPAPEKPKMTKEEQLKQLRWDRDMFELEEAYMIALISKLQESEHWLADKVKKTYKGSSLSEKEYAEIYNRVQQLLFKKLFEVKDQCTLDKEKTQKVLSEVTMQQ